MNAVKEETTISAAVGDVNSTKATENRFLISISETLPSLQECYEFVSDPGCGAVSTFCGITRDTYKGKKVQKLSYEGYVPMAIKELQKLCNDACTKYPSIAKIAAVHILKDCPVGQASVILACSSPHRIDSIQCCEYLINELKARIPIWKLEVYEDDNAVWKENMEWRQGRQERVMVKDQQTKE